MQETVNLHQKVTLLREVRAGGVREASRERVSSRLSAPESGGGEIAKCAVGVLVVHYLLAGCTSRPAIRDYYCTPRYDTNERTNAERTTGT
jgi:hypothetical protein